jgi:multicomponent Na+:H+ antiporter subunit E
MKIIYRSRLIVFVFAFLVWLALTGLRSMQEVISGVFIAALVSLVGGHFLVTTEKKKGILRRTYYSFFYLITFIIEMIKANLHVAYLVLHPLCPIKPGIIKIKTELTKDSALTVLCNSITLTPGTLTVDLEKEKQEIYIHWIDVKTISVPETTKQIGYRFEHLLKEIFE